MQTRHKTSLLANVPLRYGKSFNSGQGLICTIGGTNNVVTTQMAIAGAIGTGLIIGSGSALKNGGPGSILIGYLLMGFIVYIVMVALGEMGAWLPHKKSFSGYASRFVDPAFGYVTVCISFAAPALAANLLGLLFSLTAPTDLLRDGIISSNM